MKLRLNCVVETDMPFNGDFTLTDLRKWKAAITDKIRAQNPFADYVHVEAILACDAEQRRIVQSTFLGFVPVNQFGGHIQTSRIDFGACEDFRFTWKH